MNTLTLNPTAASLTRRHAPSINPHRPYLFKPSSSSSLRFSRPPLPRFALSSTVRASFQNPNHENPNKNLKSFNRQITDKNSTAISVLVTFLSPLRAAAVTTLTAAALIYSGFYFSSKPSIASPLSPPPTVETSGEDTAFDEEREKSITEHLLSNPNDVDELKNLMEIKVKSKKIPEAIPIIEKLMEVQPEEVEWPMMRAHMYAYNGEFGLAKHEFNELLKKDPFLLEAYHGLVTIASGEESSEDLKIIERRIEEILKLCKKEKKKSDVRDFKLLVAQIKVLESEYDEALKIYQALVKEEPRDFRPYLCQGMIYTLLRKNSEAEKNFEKYRRLIPKGHPYATYFDDNMIATKLFGQKMENERAMSNS